MPRTNGTELRDAIAAHGGYVRFALPSLDGEAVLPHERVAILVERDDALSSIAARDETDTLIGTTTLYEWAAEYAAALDEITIEVYAATRKTTRCRS